MSRAQLAEQIAAKLHQGLSVHLVSLPFWGTSRFLKELKFPNHTFVYLDANSPNFKFPTPKLIDKNPTTIIFDHFGYFLDTQTANFFQQLKGLRDSHKYHLTYLIATTRHHNLGPLSNQLDRFFELATESKFYLPSCNEEESKHVADNVTTQFQIAIKKNEIEKFINQAGGIPGLIKSLILYQGGEESSQRIKGILTQIWIALGDIHRESLVNFFTENKIPSTHHLQSWGILNDKGIKSPLLSQFIHENLQLKSNNNLLENFTKTEGYIFQKLQNKINEIVTREEIVSAGWPDADSEGVSDQAIDQTLSRIRRKIKNTPYEIKTLKARGFKLSKQ